MQRTVVLGNLEILIIFAIYFQGIQAQPLPALLPFNYYFANGTLIWMVSEDDSFFTIDGELPAMTIRYTPNLNLRDYEIISLAVIANTSDPDLVRENDNLYGDRLCDTVDGSNPYLDTYIGFIVTKQIFRFLSKNCTTPESDNPYLLSNGFHNVLSYDRPNIACNGSWFYHIFIKYKDNGKYRYPLKAIYQIDMGPGYHCDPEVYAEYT